MGTVWTMEWNLEPVAGYSLDQFVYDLRLSFDEVPPYKVLLPLYNKKGLINIIASPSLGSYLFDNFRKVWDNKHFTKYSYIVISSFSEDEGYSRYAFGPYAPQQISKTNIIQLD